MLVLWWAQLITEVVWDDPCGHGCGGDLLEVIGKELALCTCDAGGCSNVSARPLCREHHVATPQPPAHKALAADGIPTPRQQSAQGAARRAAACPGQAWRA